MNTGFDTDRYFTRIGYCGPRAATFDVLRELHALQPAAVTFENIDVILKRPVRLDIPSIADKIITRGRGGYCFEQNILFMAALRSLGFQVRSAAARVQLNADGTANARSHMVLLVSLPDAEVLADVGFGGLTLTAPLHFETQREQTTSGGIYRLLDVNGEYQLQTRLDGRWTPMYQISLAEQTAADWEMANWYVSTSPNSMFTNTLMVARSTAHGRYALRNNRLRIYRDDGTTDERIIGSAGELIETLRGDFNLKLPPSEELTAIASIAGV